MCVCVCVCFQISDAVYSLVQRQCEAQFRALEQRCEAGRPLLEASIRTDMDQIITSKEHVTNKIRGQMTPCRSCSAMAKAASPLSQSGSQRS